MTRRLALAAAVCWAPRSPAPPAAAERLVASLSRHQVMVTSNFTGTSIVLFGTVERDSRGRAPRAPATTSSSPSPGRGRPWSTRRKERVLGIWVNRRIARSSSTRRPIWRCCRTGRSSDRQRRDAAAAAARPRRQAVCRSARQRHRRRRRATIRSAAFRAAEDAASSSTCRRTNGVTFLTPTLFRAAIPLPAEVPIGNYEVDVKLFADGDDADARQFGVRGRQGRLRAVRRQRGARPRPALRPRHRDDGAADRLVRAWCSGGIELNPAGSASAGDRIEPLLAQHVRGEGQRPEHPAKARSRTLSPPV